MDLVEQLGDDNWVVCATCCRIISTGIYHYAFNTKLWGGGGGGSLILFPFCCCFVYIFFNLVSVKSDV